MTTNYRTFCRQLIEVLEQYAPLHPDDEKLISRVRAAIDSETLLEAVGMEKELCNPLRLNGYTSVEQVLEADPKNLMECKGLGPDRVGRILAALRKHQKAKDHCPHTRKMVLEPIPVSERLPGDQLCWWYEPDEDDGYGGMWTLLRIRGGTTRYSHWIPADALSQPS